MFGKKTRNLSSHRCRLRMRVRVEPRANPALACSQAPQGTRRGKLVPAHVAECRLVLLPQHETSGAEASFQCVRPPQTGGCVSNEHALASSCANATYSVRRGRGRGFRQAPRQAPYSNPPALFHGRSESMGLRALDAAPD